jgi:hypothetical protein
MCYTSFENSDLLTQHFTSVHDNDTTSNENTASKGPPPEATSSNNALSMNPAVESVRQWRWIFITSAFFIIIYLFIKILKKYTSKSLNTSDSETMNQDTKSISSIDNKLNDSFSSSSNTNRDATMLEKEFQSQKEQLQSYENNCKLRKTLRLTCMLVLGFCWNLNFQSGQRIKFAQRNKRTI